MPEPSTTQTEQETAAEQEEQTEPGLDETSYLDGIRKKLLQKIFFAHDAIMWDKIQRQNRIVEDTVRQVKNLGSESGAAPIGGGGSDGVRIGDDTYFYQQPAAEQATTPGVPPPPPESKGDGLNSTLTTIVTIAGLLTGGAGLGWGIPLILKGLAADNPAPPSVIDTDTDTTTTTILDTAEKSAAP